MDYELFSQNVEEAQFPKPVEGNPLLGTIRGYRDVSIVMQTY